jgi:predicted Rossmann fold flavoprotein
VLTENKKISAVLLADGSKIDCSIVILAMGGVTYSSTGSSGDGLEIAANLGHRIIETRPGLVPLDTVEDYSCLEGLSLQDVILCIRENGKKRKLSGKGDILFTKKGISGPLALSCSGRIVDILNAGKKVSVEIDLMPDLTEEKLLSSLNKTITTYPRKSAKNLLSGLLPKRLTTILTAMAGIDADKTANSINANERKALTGAMKNMPLCIKGPVSPDLGMITKGGVSVKDIDPRTMQSRTIKGLYFAGEVIDIDADSGGFNLQAAFSTGYLAGQSAAGPKKM